MTQIKKGTALQSKAVFLAERAGFEYYPSMGRVNLIKKGNRFVSKAVFLAERAGFEPANLCGLHAFQACALSQTTRPLQIQRADYTMCYLYGNT